MKNDNKKASGKFNSDQARIRVDGRGGAYIPSEEIASLPEVKIMQKRAANIVEQFRTRASVGNTPAMTGASLRKVKQ